MSDERITEFMAQVAEYMQSTDRKLEQLVTVMHNGFGRVSDQIEVLTDELRDTNRRVDVLTGRVDVLTGRVDALTDEVREVKTEAQITNRRVGAILTHTGQLTETLGAMNDRAAEESHKLEDVIRRLTVVEDIVLRRAS